MDALESIKETGGYFWTTQEARKGNLSVTKSTSRTYGYMLKHKPTGATGVWFKLKRDAEKKITDLITCPNS